MILKMKMVQAISGFFLVVTIIISIFGLPTSGKAESLIPIRSFPIPVFSDPDININGLAYGSDKLYALNTFYNPVTNLTEAKIYVLDPDNGNILNSFPSPFGGGLASDGVNLYVNTFQPLEGEIYQLNSTNGDILKVIKSSSVTITGGVGGLAFLKKKLFQVAGTTECNGLSIIKLNAKNGKFLGCFNIDSIGTNPRELDSNGKNLLYGTWVEDNQISPSIFNWNIFTISSNGIVLKSDTLFTTQAFDVFEANETFDVNGLAYGDNELFIADRKSNQIIIYSFSCLNDAEEEDEVDLENY